MRICRYVSPRRRARRTLELLDIGCRDRLPWHDASSPSTPSAAASALGEDGIRSEAKVQVTDDIREWDYGDYEGLTSKQIREQRRERGQGEWDIWRDGCPGGEYVCTYFLSYLGLCFTASLLPQFLLSISCTNR